MSPIFVVFVAIGTFFAGVGSLTGWRSLQQNKRAREQDRIDDERRERQRLDREKNLSYFEKARAALDQIGSACHEADSRILSDVDLKGLNLEAAARELSHVTNWIPGLSNELDSVAEAAKALSATGVDAAREHSQPLAAAAQGARQHAAILHVQECVRLARAAVDRQWGV